MWGRMHSQVGDLLVEGMGVMSGNRWWAEWGTWGLSVQVPPKMELALLHMKVLYSFGNQLKRNTIKQMLKNNE